MKIRQCYYIICINRNFSSYYSTAFTIFDSNSFYRWWLSYRYRSCIFCRSGRRHFTRIYIIINFSSLCRRSKFYCCFLYVFFISVQRPHNIEYRCLDYIFCYTSRQRYSSKSDISTSFFIIIPFYITNTFIIYRYLFFKYCIRL